MRACIRIRDWTDLAFEKKETSLRVQRFVRFCLVDVHSPSVSRDNAMHSIVSPEIVKHEELARGMRRRRTNEDSGDERIFARFLLSLHSHSVHPTNDKSDDWIPYNRLFDKNEVLPISRESYKYPDTDLVCAKLFLGNHLHRVPRHVGWNVLRTERTLPSVSINHRSLP